MREKEGRIVGGGRFRASGAPRFGARLAGDSSQRVVTTQSGRAFVRVINLKATSLTENVVCKSADYWWSLGERMHRVDDPAGAATKVARVLAAVGE